MQITETDRKFVDNVQRIIDEFVEGRLMDLVDDQAKGLKIPDDKIASLLNTIDHGDLGLEEAWEEYTE